MRALVLAACLAAGCSAPPPPMLPIVPTPPETLPPLAEIVRACAFEVSCFRDPIASSLSECITYLTAGLNDWLDPRPFLILGDGPAQYRHFIDCSNNNSDCGSVLVCVSGRYDAAFCNAHPGTVCDGDVLVPCPAAAAQVNDPALFITDCAALGMHCAAVSGGAECTDGHSCDPKSMPSCDGNRYYDYCTDAGLRYRLDCTLSGIPDATCRLGGSYSGCVPSGPPCGAARCDGDVRVTCLDRQEVRDDCTQLASHCTLVDGLPTCVPVATECDSSTKDACAGNALSTCVSGMLATIDCSAIGLSTCMQGSDGPICQ